MPLRRIARKLGHKTWFVAAARVVVPPFDRFMNKVTRGRVIALGILPSLMLTTTGKKTGKERVQPLAYIADGDDIILIASNWGGHNHPGWSYNLLANPHARVRLKGADKPVTARLVEGEERDRLWAKALQIWPAYATYEKRASHRRIRVFRLTVTG